MRCQLALSFILGVLTTLVSVANAEGPVHFNDANLKAVVEEALGVSDPNTVDMLMLTALEASERGIVNPSVA